MYSVLEISALIHATENRQKVLSSITKLLEKSENNFKIEYIYTHGHWKNPITYIKMRVDKDVDKIYNKIQASLVTNFGDNLIKNYFTNNIDNKGAFYVRLDKQNLFLGSIIPSETDSIRLTFKKKGKFER